MTTQQLHYTLYILRSRVNERFYVGTTQNLRERLLEHARGDGFAFRFPLPYDLVYFESDLSFHKAKRRERFLKSEQGRTLIPSMLVPKRHTSVMPVTNFRI